MSFTTASDFRAPSHSPSHFPQRPLSFNHPNTLYPNFEDTRFDVPGRSMTVPNWDPFLASHPQVPGGPGQNIQPPSSHLPFTIGGSSQSQDFGVPGATPSYLPEGPHAISATDPTASYRPEPSYPPSAYNTIPYAGPSRLGGEQPTPHSWNRNIAQPGPGMAAAPAPPPSTTLPLQPFNSDPREFHRFPAAPTAQAQALDVPNVTGCRRLPRGRKSTSTSPRVTTRQRGPRTTRPRAPLVRVEDEVVWVRPHVLKMTLWLNWSPNAEADAHGPWDQ